MYLQPKVFDGLETPSSPLFQLQLGPDSMDGVSEDASMHSDTTTRYSDAADNQQHIQQDMSAGWQHDSATASFHGSQPLVSTTEFGRVAVRNCMALALGGRGCGQQCRPPRHPGTNHFHQEQNPLPPPLLSAILLHIPSSTPHVPSNTTSPFHSPSPKRFLLQAEPPNMAEDIERLFVKERRDEYEPCGPDPLLAPRITLSRDHPEDRDAIATLLCPPTPVGEGKGGCKAP